MRQCPFNNCERQVPDHIFACRKHWYSLNQAHRAEIVEAYNQYLQNVIGIEELRERQQKVLGTRGTA